jgi:hypothetical protein
MRSSRYCHNYTWRRAFVNGHAARQANCVPAPGTGEKSTEVRVVAEIFTHACGSFFSADAAPGRRAVGRTAAARASPGASGVAAAPHLPVPFLVFSMNAATFACRAFKSGSCA